MEARQSSQHQGYGRWRIPGDHSGLHGEPKVYVGCTEKPYLKMPRAKDAAQWKTTCLRPWVQSPGLEKKWRSGLLLELCEGA